MADFLVSDPSERILVRAASSCGACSEKKAPASRGSWTPLLATGPGGGPLFSGGREPGNFIKQRLRQYELIEINCIYL